MQKAPLVFFSFTALAMCCFALQTPVIRTFSFVPLPETKGAASTNSFTGEISDAQCAAIGSHEMVMKKAGVKSAVNCVRGCAKKHGLVLVETGSKRIYKLDDASRALSFAGQDVTIAGPLDKPSNTIHIDTIQTVN